MADECRQVAVRQRKAQKLTCNASVVSQPNVINKSYTLNIQKSLAKKLEATKRTSVVYSMTDGGLTIQADAASFELLKEAIMQYLKSFPAAKVEYKLTSSKDTGGNYVQITVKVTFLESGESYTVNMYLTRSSFLVNGKSVSRFLQTDLRNIQRLIETVSMEGAPVNVAALNAQLKMQLTRMIGGETSTKSDAARKRRDDLVAVDRDRDSDPIKCLKCGRNCQSRAVYCEMSNHWVHYNCEKLSKQEISEIENVRGLKYICKNC